MPAMPAMPASSAAMREAAMPAGRRHSGGPSAERGHGVVMSIEQDRLTVVFDEVGCTTPTRTAGEEHDLLTPG